MGSNDHLLAAPERRHDRLVPVGEEARDGVLEAFGQRDLGGAQAAIARVMAGSVVNESDERFGLVENAQEGTDDVQILPFSLALDVVDLSQMPSLQHFPEGHDVIDL